MLIKWGGTVIDSGYYRHFSISDSSSRIHKSRSRPFLDSILAMFGMLKRSNLKTQTNIMVLGLSVILLATGFMSMPMAFGEGVSCSTLSFTNDPTAYPRCIIIDTEPPKVVRILVTPSDYVCAEVIDNTEVVKVTFNGLPVQKWQGSNTFFCSNEKLYSAIKVVAEDIAGNSSEMIAINEKQLLQKEQEQIFLAQRSVALNPHHGVEGIILSAKVPIKQVRIAVSDFEFKELQVSEYALKELYGDHEIVLDYKGQYANTEYGKERYGNIHVFAANMGHLATFDVTVKDDIVVYQQQEKKTHKPYNLDLKNPSIIEEMNLNTWQKAELEKTFKNNRELTIVQKNILVKFLTFNS